MSDYGAHKLKELAVAEAKTRESIKQILLNNVLVVKFTKKDGTVRDMICTLNPSLLPTVEKSDKEPMKENLEVIRVFDLEVKEWRSFRLNSIMNFSFSIDRNEVFGLINDK